jgi:uncharacterized membrane protein
VVSTLTAEQKDSGRAEAFSDGVFAFAITLLVLNLRDPTIGLSQTSLLDGLLAQWPSLFALATSFMTILIMWVNHHNMFAYVRKINTTLLLLNGLLLFFVVLTPFTTLLVANHVSLTQTPNGETAAVVYSGCFLMLGIVWTIIGAYCFKKGLIVRSRAERQYLVGLVSYAVAVGLAFASALASVIVILLAAVFFTFYARNTWRVGND